MPIDYVPPEQIQTPAIEIVATNTRQEILSDENLVALPTAAELQACAIEIIATQDDGFQIHDLGQIIHTSMQFLDKYPALPYCYKKAAIIEILNQIIDLTDTPYLPDMIFDPIFKALTPFFVDIVYPETVDNLALAKIAEKIDDETLKLYADSIYGIFADSFQWSDLSAAANIAVRCVNLYPELTPAEKAENAKAIFAELLSRLDTDFLPGLFPVALFQKIVGNIIDVFFE